SDHRIERGGLAPALNPSRFFAQPTNCSACRNPHDCLKRRGGSQPESKTYGATVVLLLPANFRRRLEEDTSSQIPGLVDASLDRVADVVRQGHHQVLV